ncbi:MAG TPA: apolipoprotein N-acyltransferase [Acidimicrobiia bacterium]|nr:apolipoprotein N-acyltransferase [Acidimicrobiia bacterium]
MPGRRARLAAAALSGLLLAASFPPLDLGPLALIALAPLLWAWRDAGPGSAALSGGVAGVCYFGLLVEWTRYFGAVAVVPFVLFLSLWWGLAGAIVGWLGRRGVTAAPVVAAVWVAVEAGRGRVPFGGFPWGDVGYAFHDLEPARALAAWGGVPLVSWLAVATNGWVLAAVLGVRRARRAAVRRPATAGLRPLAGVAAVLVIAGLAVAARPHLTPTGHLRVALVQGNDLNRDLTRAEIDDRYLVRNHLRLAAGVTTPVDLLVFPESSLDADPRGDTTLDAALGAVARDHHADLLAGGNIPASKDRLYNAVFHYTPDGVRTPDIYRKRHLVPFGEYVPWRNELSFIDALQAVPTDYEPGTKPVIFPVAGHRLGALVCFESAFAPLARQYARQGADALVVLTNNRSYRRSANSAQHLAMGQFRAAETGRPLLQAAISGISGLVDHTGAVRARTALFDRTVLVGEVATYRGRTPYSAVGDWAVVGSVLLLAGAAADSERRRRAALDSSR